jgi:hypothetical protein
MVNLKTNALKLTICNYESQVSKRILRTHLAVQLALQPRSFDLNLPPRIHERALSRGNIVVVTAVEDGPIGVRHHGPATAHT